MKLYKKKADLKINKTTSKIISLNTSSVEKPPVIEKKLLDSNLKDSKKSSNNLDKNTVAHLNPTEKLAMNENKIIQEPMVITPKAMDENKPVSIIVTPESSSYTNGKGTYNKIVQLFEINQNKKETKSQDLEKPSLEITVKNTTSNDTSTKPIILAMDNTSSTSATDQQNTLVTDPSAPSSNSSTATTQSSDNSSANTRPSSNSNANTQSSSNSSANTRPLSNSTANTQPLSNSTANTRPLSNSSANTQPLSNSTANTRPSSNSTATIQPLSNSSTTTQPSPSNSALSQNEENGKTQAAPQRGIEAFLQDQNASIIKNFSIEGDFSYSSYDRRQITLNGFLALDSIFLGDLSLDEVKAHIFTFDLIGRYGINNFLQAAIDVPFLYRETTFIKQGVGGSASATAEAHLISRPRMGDITTSLFTQAYVETEHFPGVIWNVAIKVPSGKYPYDIPSKNISPDGLTVFIIPSSMPTGDGMYNITTGFSFTKTVDPAVIFANINYCHNLKRKFSEIYSESIATPGKIVLGDSVTYALGIAYALNERTSMTLSYSQQVSDKDRIKLKGEEWTAQNGTNIQPANFNVGFTYGITDKLAIIANAQLGLNTDAPDFVVGIKLPYSFG